MLNYAAIQTANFLERMPKGKRKKIGQFFTSRETACFMANLFDFSKANESISILDPGAGTGILSAAIIERLQREERIKKIHLTCYETDLEVLPILALNLNNLKLQSKIPLETEIIQEDYILNQANDFNENMFANPEPRKFDFVIGNPPYLKIAREAPEAGAMSAVIHGAPNLYFLFASMSLFNLKPDGEMVYIIPRSWTSGAYFKAFREYFLKYGKLEFVHIFTSRNKVFRQENVLQETIIVKVKKTKKEPAFVTLTSSLGNEDFATLEKLTIPYKTIVSDIDQEHYVYIPTSDEELYAIQKINRYKETFPEIGLKMRTGIVVDFRQESDLRYQEEEHTVPLFYSQHIRNGRVNHKPFGKNKEWIIDSKPGLIQKNRNYVFCKRFTAKEEHRRLQCGVYLTEDFPQYEFIGTQNKINFVERIDGLDLNKETTFGIYALLNSTLFDVYYRILNGNTQVNSTEINRIPVPPLHQIEKMGQYLIQKNDLSTECCDQILEEVAYG